MIYVFILKKIGFYSFPKIFFFAFERLSFPVSREDCHLEDKYSVSSSAEGKRK